MKQNTKKKKKREKGKTIKRNKTFFKWKPLSGASRTCTVVKTWQTSATFVSRLHHYLFLFFRAFKNIHPIVNYVKQPWLDDWNKYQRVKYHQHP